MRFSFGARIYRLTPAWAGSGGSVAGNESPRTTDPRVGGERPGSTSATSHATD